jgi:septal ring factor EnvC (AmiA/AmiB activator)
MVYREYDKVQLLNKIEVLEQRIAELEEEIAGLKNTKNMTSNEEIYHQIKKEEEERETSRAEEVLNNAFRQDPEFFMSEKERRAYKRIQKVDLSNMPTDQIEGFLQINPKVAKDIQILKKWKPTFDKWKILAGIKKKEK